VTILARPRGASLGAAGLRADQRGRRVGAG
jgi:hypothetical protein